MRRIITLSLLLLVLAVPSWATTRTVKNSGGDFTPAQFQAAINATACGDTLQIEDGITLPDASYYIAAWGSPCTSWTTITRTGTLPDIPDVIGMCYVRGPTHAAEMTKKADCKAALKLAFETNAPKIQVTQAMQNAGQGSPLLIDPNADYWQFVGIEIKAVSVNVDPSPPSYGLVLIGLNHATGTVYTVLSDAPDHIRFDRVSMHGTTQGDLVRALYAQGGNIELINSLVYDVHFTQNDSQCLYSDAGPGPFTIDNNFLECAGENVLFGGGDPTTTNLIPSHITQTRNYFTKDWTWFPQVSGRVIDPATGLSYVYNGHNWVVKNLSECKNCQFNSIHDNVMENAFEGQQNTAVIFQAVANGPACTWCTVKDIEVYGNVIRHSGVGITIGGRGSNYNGATMAARINFHHNLMYDMNFKYSITGANYGNCFLFVSGSYSSYIPPAQTPPALDSVWFDHNTCDNDGRFGTILNPGDWFTNLRITNNIGRGKDPFGTIAIACGCNGGTEGFDQFAPSGYQVSNNAFATPSQEWTWPADNWFLQVLGDPTATYNLFKAIFTNWATADFTVAVGSEYKSGGARDATDGTDLGADFALLPGGSGATPSKVRLPFLRVDRRDRPEHGADRFGVIRLERMPRSVDVVRRGVPPRRELARDRAEVLRLEHHHDNRAVHRDGGRRPAQDRQRIAHIDRDQADIAQLMPVQATRDRVAETFFDQAGHDRAARRTGQRQRGWFEPQAATRLFDELVESHRRPDADRGLQGIAEAWQSREIGTRGDAGEYAHDSTPL